jgi:mannose-1-phosphate guanylyltransferase
MAGGVGSRFWPASRAAKPKQFHDLLGTGRSLLQATYDRFQRFVPARNIYVVTNQQYVDLVREQLPELSQGQVLAEPSMRNTAPCIAYATHVIHNKNPRACIVSSPADHLILDSHAYANDILLALEFASKADNIVTLGIRPTRPDTGYGYIQLLDERENETNRLFKVKTFVEKPSHEIAVSFLNSGDYVWNSGLFIFSAQTMLEAFAAYLPDLHELFSKYDSVAGTKRENAFINNVYAKCKNISIDFGVMEKAQNVYVIRSSFGWSDLGTWNSLYQQLDKNKHGNVVHGQSIEMRSTGNIVYGDKSKLIVLNGVKDMVVIDMPDVLLVCDRNDEQFIREIVAEVKKQHGDRFV